jgi:hypothetical protein
MSASISSIFKGIAYKRLSEVEINPKRSNQHELAGTKELKSILGTVDPDIGKRYYQATCMYLDEGFPDSLLRAEVQMSWYDTRRDKPNRSPEYRLYYPTNDVISNAMAGDLLVVALLDNGDLLVLIAKADSTIERQLLWLFGIEELAEAGFEASDSDELARVELDYTKNLLLAEIGIEPDLGEVDWLGRIHAAFGEAPGFPPTAEFSDFARRTAGDMDPIGDPDRTLVRWMTHEEVLFHTLEMHFINQRLARGFMDANEFIRYSLSVQNRRKSRAGHALEHHLAEVLRVNGIAFSRGDITENRSRPDFLFPDAMAYRNPDYPEGLLDMLGVKTTCKDRWRQVLSEAARIRNKHLLTLESGISENQTDEMRANELQLVIPESIRGSYKPTQSGWLMSISEFIGYRKAKS